MLTRNHFVRHLYRRPEGDPGTGGGGAGGLTPEQQAAVDAAVAAQVTGLKAKNQELLGKLSEAKTSLQRFDGIDPDAVRNILKRFSDDEEAAMIAKGEIDKVLERRTERLRTDLTAKVTEAQTAAEKATARAKAYETRVLDNTVRAAAAKAGLHPHAIEDALLYARGMFTVNDQGEAVALDATGHPILGKDGKTPLSAEEWLLGTKASKPHWFPASASGSGAGGGGGNGGGTDFAKNARDMTPAEKAAFIKTHGGEAWSKKVGADYAAPAKAA